MIIATIPIIITLVTLLPAAFAGTTDLSQLVLNVTSPDDEAIVTSPDIFVEGTSAINTFIITNGEQVDVNADGSFKTTISLQEGSNSIHIVASDREGNEESKIITVIYIP